MAGPAETTAKLTLCNRRADQPGWTKSLVQQAVDRYNKTGLEETAAYYNSDESVDGQWYVFIADDTKIIAHATAPQLIGTPTKDITTENGYPSGAAVVAVAGPEGGWTSYSSAHPETGMTALKHTYAVESGGLIFGSGWYEPSPSMDEPEAYTKALVQQAIELQAALGDDAAIEYYNDPAQVHGPWYVFVIRRTT